jgi:hypothetical protein
MFWKPHIGFICSWWSKINDVKEYRRGNQNLTIQRNWQHRVHKAKKNKNKNTPYMCWTPLHKQTQIKTWALLTTQTDTHKDILDITGGSLFVSVIRFCRFLFAVNHDECIVFLSKLFHVLRDFRPSLLWTPFFMWFSLLCLVSSTYTCIGHVYRY